MFTLKEELGLVVLVIVVTGISLFLFPLHWNNPQQTAVVAETLIPSILSPTPTTVQLTPNPLQITTQDSPDGTKTLTMKKQQNKLTTTYSFFTTNTSDPQQIQIYATTVDQSHTFSLPFNSWSPDNAYVFIKEDITNAQSNYYVFSSSGNALSNSSQYLNVTDFFVQRNPGYTLTDVTGWAAPTLLIINTDTTNGEFGPSLWFDVSSQSFIPLATRFN